MPLVTGSSSVAIYFVEILSGKVLFCVDAATICLKKNRTWRDIEVEAVISSFLVSCLTEMGDKTQWLALALAARYRRPWPILAGITVAVVINRAIAVCAEKLDRHSPLAGPTGCFSGSAISVRHLGALCSRRCRKVTVRAPVFLTTAVLFFLAEMGDKTQLATAALGASYHSPWLVTIGSTRFGLLASDGGAVFLEKAVLRKIPRSRYDSPHACSSRSGSFRSSRWRSGSRGTGSSKGRTGELVRTTIRAGA